MLLRNLTEKVCPSLPQRLLSQRLNHNATSNNRLNSDRKMRAWQFHEYNDEIQYTDMAKIPGLTSANDVLVKVRATSVNPIDVAMSSKYAKHMFFPCY